VARYAIELGGDHSNIFGALRDFDPDKFFNRQDEPMIEEHPGKVIQSACVREKLLILPVFSHLLVAAVTVSDDRVGFDNIFSVQIQKNPENTVRAGMLGSEV
jgi:hypothetical protein